MTHLSIHRAVRGEDAYAAWVLNDDAVSMLLPEAVDKGQGLSADPQLQQVHSSRSSHLSLGGDVRSGWGLDLLMGVVGQHMDG